MKNLRGMMKQAQKMQEQLQQQMQELKVEAASGGGMVSVQMDGSKKLLSIDIQPAAADPDDVEMLQDLILAAIHEASRKVDEEMGQQLGGLAGMMGM